MAEDGLLSSEERRTRILAARDKHFAELKPDWRSTDMAHRAIVAWLKWVPWEDSSRFDYADRGEVLRRCTGKMLVLENERLDFDSLSELLARVRQLGYTVATTRSSITICNEGLD